MMYMQITTEDYKAEAISDIRQHQNAKLEGTCRVLHLRKLWRAASRKYYDKRKQAAKLDKALTEASK
jgi:hypothetical protein